MCFSARRMVPAVGFSRPATRLSSVLLPQPEWPISVTNSPLRIARSMPVSATKSPFLVSKVLSTDSTLRHLCIGEAPAEHHHRLLDHHPDDPHGEHADDD